MKSGSSISSGKKENYSTFDFKDFKFMKMSYEELMSECQKFIGILDRVLESKRRFPKNIDETDLPTLGPSLAKIVKHLHSKKQKSKQTQTETQPTLRVNPSTHTYN